RKVLANEIKPEFIKYIEGGTFIPKYVEVVSSTPDEILNRAAAAEWRAPGAWRLQAMAWQRVASRSEIAVDGVLGLDVDGSPVALYRLANEVFATAGICTHALAVLSDSFVEDGKIECPLHQGQFDIRSGKALCAPATEDLRTYAVKLEGDDVLIDMEQPAAYPPTVLNPVPDRRAGGNIPATDTCRINATNPDPERPLAERYVWPAEGLT